MSSIEEKSGLGTTIDRAKMYALARASFGTRERIEGYLKQWEAVSGWVSGNVLTHFYPVPVELDNVAMRIHIVDGEEFVEVSVLSNMEKSFNFLFYPHTGKVVPKV